jgi:hypothetical protein
MQCEWGTCFISPEIGTDRSFKIVPGGIKAETRQTLDNIRNTLERYGSSLDQVVKCTVMMACCPNQIICRNTVSFVLPLRALYPLTAQSHSMGELSAYRLKQHPLPFGTFCCARVGTQTVLDVALTKSFSGSDVYE